MRTVLAAVVIVAVGVGCSPPSESAPPAPASPASRPPAPSPAEAAQDRELRVIANQIVRYRAAQRVAARDHDEDGLRAARQGEMECLKQAQITIEVYQQPISIDLVRAMTPNFMASRPARGAATGVGE